jgi:two-component sensor histidine kinase
MSLNALSRPEVLGSIRARLMVLLTIAAIPLVAMAGLVAWQNYRMTADKAEQAVLRGLEASSARHEAALDGVGQMLAAVTQADPIRLMMPDPCDAFLADILALNRDRFSSLRVFDQAGRLRCAAPWPVAAAENGPADPSWFERVSRTDRLVVGPVRSSPSRANPSREVGPGGNGSLLVVARPILEGARFDGALAADLRMDWFADQSILPNRSGAMTAWLFSPEGTPLPVGAATEQALPEGAALAGLFGSRSSSAGARSRDDRPFFYASAELSDGLRLLVGYDASEAVAEGRAVLIRRFVELAFLLLLGIVAVGVGVHIAVVQPLRRLTEAVERWRAGAPFTPGVLAGEPSEVAELASSFSQATAALAERGAQLRIALIEQDNLVQEIHHRVKNNLQVVSSLLNLQASRIRLPEARSEFQSARHRVHALATLHRHLYAQGELQSIDMPSFLEELCGQLFQALGEMRGERINLEIEAPELRMSSDQAVPLALLVTEAVSNAVKYAFPGGVHGNISIRLAADSERAHLVIEDDGIGIPASRAEAEAGIRDGIGIHLIRGFARQLGASLTVQEGNGTRYTVDLPLQTEASRTHDPRLEAAAET